MTFFPLRRPTLGRTLYLVLFAAYISVCLNFAYYQRAWKLIGPDSIAHCLFFLSMPLLAFSVICLVLTLASLVKLSRVVITLFVILSATAQYFIMNYNIVLDRSMMVNMLDTTPAESLALLDPPMVVTLLLTIVPAVFLAWWLKIKPETSLFRSLGKRLLTLLTNVLCILLVALVFYKDYASLFRNHHELIKSVNPSNSIMASLSWYKHHRLAEMPLIRIGEDAHQEPAMTHGKPELTIMVLGETSRAQDFSLSGYARDTNPLLSKDNVIYYPHTSSCGTSTAVSVPCMFSNMPRKDYNDVLAAHQEGALDVLHHAGVSVLWNDNDGGCKGACDRLPHQDMTALDLPGQCIDGECYDEVLFHQIEDAINHLKGNGIIILHTIGSHGPTYYHRYPPAFRKFTPTCDTNEIQSCSREQLVNTYDNTILYVDYIVNKSIDILKEHQNKFTTSLVYLSDHGESLGEDGAWLHGMPYAIAPSQQTHIPMLLWLSPDYQQRFHVSQRCLQNNADHNPYSQDNVFSTLLGLFGVQTREYHPADDLLTGCRSTG
ncbi:phosphoethanolamine transferase EptA [Tatumella saanichensis]|uniref:phosphoethanolamine transferase EptA n=1 Tax=Tatumella saanichensis TaxID=480813 RepID=UPI0004A494A0|nr:phosphoethanolamine transferase EptA [Tatumella saanichensis]